jgi:hypothetical protein
MGLCGFIEHGEECLPLSGGKRKFSLFSQFNLRNGASALHNEFSDGLPFAMCAFAQERLFGVGYSRIDPA